MDAGSLLPSCGARRCFGPQPGPPRRMTLYRSPLSPRAMAEAGPLPRSLSSVSAVLDPGTCEPRRDPRVPAPLPETPTPYSSTLGAMLPKSVGTESGAGGLAPLNLHIPTCNSIKRSDNLSLWNCAG